MKELRKFQLRAQELYEEGEHQNEPPPMSKQTTAPRQRSTLRPMLPATPPVVASPLRSTAFVPHGLPSIQPFPWLRPEFVPLCCISRSTSSGAHVILSRTDRSS